MRSVRTRGTELQVGGTAPAKAAANQSLKAETPPWLQDPACPVWSLSSPKCPRHAWEGGESVRSSSPNLSASPAASVFQEAAPILSLPPVGRDGLMVLLFKFTHFTSACPALDLSSLNKLWWPQGTSFSSLNACDDHHCSYC